MLIEDRDITLMSDRARTLFRRRRVGVVFQAFNLLPTLSAEENVALPLLVDGVGKVASDAKVGELLALSDLTHRRTHRPQALSGGEQQRVAIARALVTRPSLLLADEPTGNLDSATSIEILALFQELNDQGLTIVMVTHETDIARYARRIVELCDGEIVRDEPVPDRRRAEQDRIALVAA